MTTQQKKHFPLAAAMLLLMASTTQAAGNEHQFAIGPTAGLAIFSGDIGDGDEKTKLKPNFGLAARYNYKGNAGWFAGLQLALSKETAKYAESVSVPASSFTDEGVRFDVSTNDYSASVKPKWSMDALFRIGRDYGAVSPYVAAGVSLVSVKAEASGVAALTATSPLGSTSGSFRVNSADTKTHLGWKIAGGIDYDVSEKVQVFVQGYYADFGKKKNYFNTIDATVTVQGFDSANYSNIEGVPTDLDLSGYGAQLGILFKF